MEFDNPDPRQSLKLLDKIIDFAKWMWNLEKSETGIINTIFAVIFFAVIIISCFYFKNEGYFLLLLILFIFLMGYSLITVSKTEQEMEKMKYLRSLEEKYEMK